MTPNDLCTAFVISAYINASNDNEWTPQDLSATSDFIMEQITHPSTSFSDFEKRMPLDCDLKQSLSSESESIDLFVQFLSDLPVSVESTSPLGEFMHQFQVQVSQMSFSEVSLFQQQFLEYLNGTDTFNTKNDFEAHLESLEQGDLEQSLLLLHRFSNMGLKQRQVTPQQMSLFYVQVFDTLGLRSEALDCVKKAIPFARDEHDDLCLGHLLAWLHQLTHDQPAPDTSPSHHEILESLVKRAKESKMHSFYVSCLLLKAKWLVQTQGSKDQVLELLDTAYHISKKHSINTDLVLQTRMACLYIYGEHSKALLVGKQLEQGSPEQKSLLYSSMALLHHGFGNKQDSEEYLKKAEKETGFKGKKHYRKAHSMIGLRNAMADHSLEIDALAHDWFQWLQNDTGQLCLDKGMYLEHIGQQDQAAQHYQQYLNDSQDYQLKRAQVLLSLGDVQLKNSGPYLALNAILSCVTVCKEYGLELMLHYALCRFAHILLLMGYVQRSIKLLYSLHPFISANGDQNEKHYLFKLMSLCALENQEMEKGLELLEQAQECNMTHTSQD
ncbi:hypothetical protein EDD86DRAFT_197337 [Gorgonomyces haynaldii]|nr:hypothetical protein EDD86DRAFT_197337 [Gorgonomyces haynaldii]